MLTSYSAALLCTLPLATSISALAVSGWGSKRGFVPPLTTCNPNLAYNIAVAGGWLDHASKGFSSSYGSFLITPWQFEAGSFTTANCSAEYLELQCKVGDPIHTDAANLTNAHAAQNCPLDLSVNISSLDLRSCLTHLAEWLTTGFQCSCLTVRPICCFEVQTCWCSTCAHRSSQPT